MSLNKPMSSMDPSLSYLSIYDAVDGTRKTSYVVGIHGNTIEELKTKASTEYPGAIYLEQTGVEWNNAVQNNLIYDVTKKQLVNAPEPTAEEIQAQKLAELDAEYAKVFADYDEQIIRAVTVDQDEEYANELRAEKAEKQKEYAEKRGAL